MKRVNRIRLLIVDDHEVVRVGLRAVLERQPHFEVVGEASTAAEAVAKASSLKPDAVIMDIRMTGGNGVEACREIREENPAIRVIMLTSYSDDEALFGSIMAGASGYVLKQVGTSDLVAAVEAVARGESLLDPSVTTRVLERLKDLSWQAGAEAKLNEHELRILKLLGEGKTNREIAATLYLSEKTVRNYVSSILSKLNLSNRTQAACYAVKRGMVGKT
ncbi:MAG: response regulator transcription factor [Bacillota bacterium]